VVRGVHRKVEAQAHVQRTSGRPTCKQGPQGRSLCCAAGWELQLFLIENSAVPQLLVLNDWPADELAGRTVETQLANQRSVRPARTRVPINLANEQQPAITRAAGRRPV